MREELTGRIESEGWPVIFVQADLPGQPWWCQAPVTKLDGGRFTAKVVFGDELTPSGMKFRIAAIAYPHSRRGAQVRARLQATGPSRRFAANGGGRFHASMSRFKIPALQWNRGVPVKGMCPSSLSETDAHEPISFHRGRDLAAKNCRASSIILGFISQLCPVAVQAGERTPIVVKVQRN